MPSGLSRRQALMTGLGITAGALTGCLAHPGDAKLDMSATPLKLRLPYPIANIAQAVQLDDPQWVKLTTTHFARLTAEWQMKMEYLLLPDGGFRFDAADRLLRFTDENGMKLHGHGLIWYAQDNAPYFQTLKRHPELFQAAYDRFVTRVSAYFKGRLSGWDVVNEPLDQDGQLRPCLWLQHFGEAYMERAFRLAHAADPETPLFLNEADLETRPSKLRAFMALIEKLMKAGVPISGIGTQTHITAALASGALKSTLATLASLGLKLHVSELDISIMEASQNPLELGKWRMRQIALLDELIEAYQRVPSAQQYGITWWGLRDSDSWLNQHDWFKFKDEPCLFDSEGNIKPLAASFHN